MRMILCQVDDLGETFTFSECNFATQAPGPFNYQTCVLFTGQPVATSIEGAKQMLGDIVNNTNINGAL